MNAKYRTKNHVTPINKIDRKVKDKGSSSFTGDRYTEDEIEFGKAIDRYKRENNRPFPTYSEILDVLKSLGYRKTKEGDNNGRTENSI